MAKFEARNGDLYINGKKVLKAWESFSGWYWFATEKIQEQTSMIRGKPVKDIIWYGFVQGLEEEWGDFSQAEIESLAPRTWRIREKDLPYAGRRSASNPRPHELCAVCGGPAPYPMETKVGKKHICGPCARQIAGLVKRGVIRSH